MNGTRTHRQGRARYTGGAGAPSGPRGVPMYYGWSHQNQAMEMMDLPGYLDSFRQGYEQALQDLQGRLASMTQAMVAPGSGPGVAQGWGGPATAPPTWQGKPQRRHHHDHDRDHDHECREDRDHDHEREERLCRDFDCDDDDDCRCECCIGDADVVVYGRCGEVRVIPIEIENDTRKVREDVDLDVTDVRSAGGRILPWKVFTQARGPLTLDPCSTTKIELLVHIVCGEASNARAGGTVDVLQKVPPTKAAKSAVPATPAAGREDDPSLAVNLGRLDSLRTSAGDVDRCEVGYVTIRLGGCLVRPIVVAIAVLPSFCGAYHVGCSCSCC
ncbi:MAG: hypothetical protein M3083_24455 [Actinomycetota bacterium]|nr:hypothetical protein [Actinomycetota bacterium]MDQ6947658.1 hypothetical protein [Actinomycetota bacterium]